MNSKCIFARWSSTRTIGVVLGLLATSLPFRAATAQTPPPVTGTVALEGTVEKFYKAANIVVVKTIDGVEHVLHFTKDVLVHGGKGAGIDALEGLRKGNTVVVHYTAAGKEEAVQEIDRVSNDGLQITEGTVVRVNRRQKQIVIRFHDGTTETLRLTDSAAADSGTDVDDAGSTAEVKVYFTNEAGQKVVHYFRRMASSK